MKTIDAQKIALKILRFDVLKYPSTSSKAVMRREAKTAKDALAVAVSRLAQSQNVALTNMPRVQIVSDKNAAEWVRS